MNFLWAIYEFLVCGIDVGLIYLFLSQMKDIKSAYPIRYAVLGGAVTALLVFVMTYLEIFSFWKVGLGWFISSLYGSIFFKGSIWKKLLYVTIAFGLLGLFELIALTFVSAVTSESLKMVGITQNIYRICYTIISKSITVIFYRTMARFRTDRDYFVPVKYRLIFLFIFLAAIATIFLMLNTGSHLESSNILHGAMAIVSTILFLIYGIVYYLLYQMCIHFTEASQKNMLEYQNETLNKYVLEKEAADEEIRVLSHDLKHFLVDLRAMLREGRIETALESIGAYHQNIRKTDLLDAGIPIGTAIINRTCAEARQSNIKFRLDGFFEEGIKMDQADIGALIGNILDNALEAAVKVIEPDKREITICIRRDQQFLYFEVKNGYEFEPIVRNRVFLTRKANRVNHGIGMLSINRIVKKYEGFVEFTYSDGYFKAFVMMPVYDKII